MLGFGKLAAKIFGSSNEKALKAVSSIVTKINGYEDQIKKLSDLLDKINTALMSDMPEDCVCCNSVDINSTDVITVQHLNFSPLINNNKILESYYDLNIKSLIKLTNESRAPPLV